MGMLSADQGTAPFSLSPTLSPSSSSRPVKCFACGQIFAARCGYSFSLCTVSSFSCCCCSPSTCCCSCSCCSSGRDFGHAACRRPFSRFSCVFFLLFFSCFSFCFSSILLFFAQLAPSKPKLRGSAAFRVIKKCGQLCPQPRPHPWRCTHLGTRFTSQLCQAARNWGRRRAKEEGGGRGTAFAVVHFC